MAKPIKTAVILAAFMGTRLERISKWVPKGILKLGDKLIIEESISRKRTIQRFKRAS